MTAPAAVRLVGLAVSETVGGVVSMLLGVVLLSQAASRSIVDRESAAIGRVMGLEFICSPQQVPNWTGRTSRLTETANKPPKGDHHTNTPGA
ncbi:hypothetical protein GCM10008957_39040 [Deinococcus ruber]|uniref:Uncharacterized protein n=1 Tax=Deinococcus ruber TaxID=1848197 RepID=A0A918CGW5_9DEIO|nr:hypothetical protein GCM10008957_39040 [Deinococcus ruber]